jgi:hypothetical protein
VRERANTFHVGVHKGFCGFAGVDTVGMGGGQVDVPDLWSLETSDFLCNTSIMRGDDLTSVFPVDFVTVVLLGVVTNVDRKV